VNSSHQTSYIKLQHELSSSCTFNPIDSAVCAPAAAVEYSGPEPGKGQHRYVLLLFQQPSFQSITPPSKRANFQTKQVGCHAQHCTLFISLSGSS
jgi:phosphatidylethanolamine-binding protein (PEBP) family uncharacterized protein